MALNMFAKMRTPVSLSPAELDSYLAQGWFRMRQTIFTTNFLHFNSNFYSVLWLRVALEGFVECKKHRSLKKLNAKFRTEVRKAALTAEHEELYRAYRNAVSFEVSPTLHDLLIGNETYNRYDTYEVNIYDEDKLIAVGFFDLGQVSAAGISCIYDPDYKKFSLGKYLMFTKIDFCRQQGLRYFYPGYLVPGYRPFDYKAEIGKDSLEWFRFASNEWLPFENFTASMNPILCMREKLFELKKRLEYDQLGGNIVYYKFFDAGLDPGYSGNDLFDFPVFLYISSSRNQYKVVVYDVRDNRFHLLQCSAIVHLDYNPYSENIFSSSLLKIDKKIFTTPQVDEVVKVLPAMYK
jgi:leucyl-tRNA---protein transferase